MAELPSPSPFDALYGLEITSISAEEAHAHVAVRDGTIRAVARRRHRGRTTWVWEVDILDDGERVCALVRMTVAIRDVP